MVEPPKDPTSFTFYTYAWVIFVSAWGGVANFMRKMRTGAARPFNFIELIGEICTSSFAGLVTFWLTTQADIAPLYGAVLIAISGHMGTRSIGLIEYWATKRFIPDLADEDDGQAKTTK